MPKPMKPRITQWSFSRYRDYCQCPRKAKYKHVDRLPDPPSDAMARGTAIHKMAEDYVLGNLKRMPAELEMFEEEFREARKGNPLAEAQWAFTADWTPCEWFARECWCRVKTDLVYTAQSGRLVVVDHKTGRPNADHDDQLSLYALAAFVMMPEVEELVASLWYLDHAKDNSKTYTRDQHDDLRRFWFAKTKPMLSDTQFVATPSNKCRWCVYRKENGGPCEF